MEHCELVTRTHRSDKEIGSGVIDLREALDVEHLQGRVSLFVEAQQVLWGRLRRELGGEVRFAVGLRFHRRKVRKARLRLSPVDPVPIYLADPGLFFDLKGAELGANAICWIWLQQTHKESLCILAYPRRKLDGLALHTLLDHDLVVTLVVRQGAGQKAVQQTAKAVVVQGEAMALSCNHLRTQVAGGSHKGCEECGVGQVVLRQSKVGEPYVALIVQQAVLWLEITVKNILGVQILQSQQDLAKVELAVGFLESAPL
mmetsp:Transcript_6245/g.13510  ORF Transcript_6245/g.13510 Transcript_6245/m.13510 type:complete len:258 (-) Transcript_6245:309-1082(-)